MARGSKKAIAMECLKDPVTRAYLRKGIGVLVRNELKAMCMDSTSSILRSTSSQDLKGFTWDTLLLVLGDYTVSLLHRDYFKQTIIKPFFFVFVDYQFLRFTINAVFTGNRNLISERGCY